MKEEKKKPLEITPWEAWIARTADLKESDIHSYDLLLELAVSSYGLDKKSRKMELKDQCQCLFIWWHENKRFFKRYTTLSSVGALAGGKDHATVRHAIHDRKKSYNYKENTKCIKDFLDS